MTTANAKNDARSDIWPPQTPEEYLAVANRYFMAEDYYAGSDLLYYSTVCALAQLGKIYGQPCGTREELKAFAVWLDEKHGQDRRHYEDLMVAFSFHDNAKYRYIPPDEIDFIQPLVREFIATLLSYRQKAARRD